MSFQFVLASVHSFMIITSAFVFLHPCLAISYLFSTVLESFVFKTSIQCSQIINVSMQTLNLLHSVWKWEPTLEHSSAVFLVMTPLMFQALPHQGGTYTSKKDLGNADHWLVNSSELSCALFQCCYDYLSFFPENVFWWSRFGLFK
jgi:hypothetical protein